MNNFIMVRTDLIDPHAYLEAEMNYKDLLQVLEQVGGYALYQQIYKYYGEKSKGYREINKMQQLLLVGTEKLNNNRYIYLKITALKYLQYRDVEDISNISINRKLVKPGYRPLLNSIYSFENYLENSEMINTELSLKILDKVIEKCRSILRVNRIPNIHLVKVEKDESVEGLKIALKILGERNGIYLTDFEENTDFANSVLKFSCYDLDQDFEENSILKILRLISSYLNRIGTKNYMNCCKFSVEIITLSQKKKDILQTLEERAMLNIKKKQEAYNKNKSAKIISGISTINYRILPNIEGYIDTTSKGDSEFSFVDTRTVDRLDELKEVLKGVKKKDEEKGSEE